MKIAPGIPPRKCPGIFLWNFPSLCPWNTLWILPGFPQKIPLVISPMIFSFELFLPKFPQEILCRSSWEPIQRFPQTFIQSYLPGISLWFFSRIRFPTWLRSKDFSKTALMRTFKNSSMIPPGPGETFIYDSCKEYFEKKPPEIFRFSRSKKKFIFPRIILFFFSNSFKGFFFKKYSNNFSKKSEIIRNSHKFIYRFLQEPFREFFR